MSIKWHELMRKGQKLYLRGEFIKAIEVYQEACNEAKKVFGEYNFDYAQSLSNLAVQYRKIGNYREAEPLCIQSTEIYKKLLGENNQHYAISINNLALIYKEMGEYCKAELYYLRIREIWELIGEGKRLNSALCLNNLAVLYEVMGEYNKAEPLLKESMEIRATVLGENHPDYVQSLNNLAGFYHTVGDYSKSELYYKKLLEIAKIVLGETHPDYIASLNNMAALLKDSGEYNQAKSLYMQVLKTCKTMLGENNPDYVTYLSNLALLYKTIGEYDQAELLLNKALNIYKEALGEELPGYAICLFNMALLEIILNKKQAAFEKMYKAICIHNKMIMQMFYMGYEKRIADYIHTFQIFYYAFLTFFKQNHADFNDYTPKIFDLILKRKGINLEIAALRRDSILANSNPVLQSKFKELRHKICLRGNLLYSGPGSTPFCAYLQKISSLKREIFSLERELALQVPQVELQNKLASANHKAIAAHLPTATALIEFVCIKAFESEKISNQNLCYLALILCQESPEDIRMIDLGDAGEIDALIIKFRDEITKMISVEDDNTGILLYQKLLQPILDKIDNKKKLLISTDGNIALLPFEILPQPNQRYVIEDYAISYIDSGRDLIRFSYHVKPQQTKALVIADPDYDLAASNKQLDRLSVPNRCSFEIAKALRKEEDRISFVRLPDSKFEGEKVKELINADIWTQDMVLDAKIKQIQRPRILHIATHGFFLPKQRGNKQDLLEIMIGSCGKHFAYVEKTYENPLLRSALTLAGVNTFLHGKEPVEDAEDGLLTALDVTGMDLAGTELVVLSACETGLGEVQTGEGIFGLRRAFTIAGARTLVVSLWKVPDKKTKELMDGFYQKILRNEKKAVALRETQREMIRRLREKGRRTSPFLWGAFICIGDPEVIRHH